MNNKRKCFVIMPFSETDSLAEEKWTEIFEHILKPAVEESGFGYECKRYGLGRANIVKDILEDLNRAQVVIADLTDSNPNVLWELGVRHTLSKRTILIAQDKKFLPSDLKDYPIITYKYKQIPTEVSKFRREIKDKLEDIETNPEKADNPVADFLQERNIELLSIEKKAILKKLAALISELSFNLPDINLILRQLRGTLRKRKKGLKGPRGTPVRLSNTCLEHLVTIQYILLPHKLLDSIKLFNTRIKLINTTLDLRPQFGEEVEERLIGFLPNARNHCRGLLKVISQIRLDYANDNYQQPIEPPIILSRPEHEKYLKLTG